MPAEFDKMVDGIKSSLRKLFPKMNKDEINSRAYAIAVSKWKKSHGGQSPFK